MTELAQPPQGTVCASCIEAGGWWWHLRRCVACGHIGCCDSSPARHAREHAATHGHPVMTTFEPDEDWFWDFELDAPARPVPLSPPFSRPLEQACPGPAGNVPDDWEERLN
ncbi:hypothetical protein ARHIZOSPH14_17340 [Agromyces rhizosphaerae]|uniref:UBP-type domain-containing protein n=1 Tax=Agromyces rhizosphaerae TaxID=88374 RepID=A0A9W6CVY5_9MICO|nr:UBP-type zinc finger domain-containing protein [Agromyces rhizosphaerae]GLI27492.1 hypothetical protein ARHIZOSPH14_17340 [Agromyces rhizosphaerae]